MNRLPREKKPTDGGSYSAPFCLFVSLILLREHGVPDEPTCTCQSSEFLRFGFVSGQQSQGDVAVFTGHIVHKQEFGLASVVVVL